MPYWKNTITASAAVAVLPFASPASAHHVMDGALPSTGWQGLLSGLAHPIIGIDHLAFIIGVGLMAHLAGRIALLPLLFVVGTVLGCFMHIQGYDLPWSELVIAAHHRRRSCHSRNACANPDHHPWEPVRCGRSFSWVCVRREHRWSRDGAIGRLHGRLCGNSILYRRGERDCSPHDRGARLCQ